MSTADRDDLDAILAKHEPSYQVDGDYGERQWIECTCDSEYFVETDAGWAEHRAHVAQMVLESDWLRGERAKELRDAENRVIAEMVCCHIYEEAGQHPEGRGAWIAANKARYRNHDLCYWAGASANLLRDRADRVDAEDGEN